MNMDNIWNIVLIFAAIGGFALAFYIYRKKSSRKTMICPFNSDCDAVVHSKHSKFFGVPVEILGLLYYGLTAASYALSLIFPAFISPIVAFELFIITVMAFLFSLYLTFIQAFAIKQWCAWCLTSAGLCSLIFASSLSVSDFNFASLLIKYRDFIVVLRSFGVALGVGGATISGIFLFKFLKDIRISEWEAEALHVLSQVVWFALAFLAFAGAGLYLPDAGELNQSAGFFIEMIIIAAIIANGAVLNLLIIPNLVKISLEEKHSHYPGELRNQRKTAFALGAISIVSWYSIFVLKMFQQISSSGFPRLVLAYLLLLGGALVASQVVERFLAKQSDSV